MAIMNLRTPLFLVGFILILSGCGVASIKPDMPLPAQNADAKLPDTTKTKLVVFNASNRLFFREDRAGKLNVTLDGKKAGSLNIGQYIVLAMDPGDHEIQLHHRDVLNFRTIHTIAVSGTEQYLKVYARILSNGAKLLDEKPVGFDSKFKAAY